MKKIKKKLLAFLMAICLVIGIAMPGDNSQAATSSTRYDGGYGIDAILSQFQFFTSGDVTLDNSGHTVGSVAVGGTLDMSNTFGDAGIVPSYIKTVGNATLGTAWHGKVPVKSEIVYYGEDPNNRAGQGWYQDAAYMDMTAAFTAIKAESAALVNVSYAEDITLSNGSITIDLTAMNSDVVYNITYADFAAAGSFNIKVNSPDWFTDHLCVINITGVNGTNFTFDGYSKVQINGQQLGMGLESMSGADTEYTSQLNYSGMNLLWNLPDATGTITAQGLGGHFVAPSATINFASGNYEGGVIAKSITGGAEGHFYPMSRQLPKSTTVATADGTFSKKAVSADGAELAGASMKLTYVSGGNNILGVTKTAGPEIIKTVENNKNIITWTSTTTPLELSGLPEGEWVLSETAAPEGYSYATDITFKVDSDGKIYQKNSDGTYSTTAVTTLTMVDEVKTGSITLEGTKALKGRDTDETFTFEVYEGSTKVSTGTVTGAGKITFTPITYSGLEDIGTHTYTIEEVDSGATDMVYDTTTKTVVVEVADNGGDYFDTTITSGADFTFTNTNKAIPIPEVSASVSILKTDGSNPLSGAKLRLTRISGDTENTNLNAVTATGATLTNSAEYVEWTSTGSAVTLSGLPYGQYVLSEISAPSGYNKAADIQVSVGATENGDGSYTPVVTWGSGNTGTVTMVDAKKTGELTLTGTKMVIGDSIDETFKFEVYEGTTLVSTGTVDGAGAITFTPISYTATGNHDYTVKEIAGSTDGVTYDTSVKTVKVGVTDDGSDTLKVSFFSESEKIEFINRYTKPTEVITPEITGTDATFSKKAVSADGNEIAGAKLTLTYTSGTEDLRHVVRDAGPGIVISGDNKTITWTSTTTPLELSNLPDGEYTLTETAAPEGYDYATDMKFKIEDGKVYQWDENASAYSTSENPNLTMVDEAKVGSITLTGTKKLTGDTAPVETYNFVVMEGSAQVATGSVNGAGDITFTEIKYEGPEDMGLHTYTITETAGITDNMFYDKSEFKVVVNVTDDGKAGSDLTAKVVAASSDTVEFTNKYTIPGNLTVTVYDDLTKDVVPNAEVEITDPQGDKTTYTTDADGKITLTDIEPGDYYIETVKVPEGYSVSLGETENAEVKAGETTTHDVYIVIPGDLIVTVYDEKTGDVVPGATVEITNPDGETTEYKTDENGQIILESTEPGDYVIETVEVPSGYEVTLGKEETATVVSKEETTHDVYIDISTPGGLIITVYDEKTGEVVPGATVEVTNYTGAATTYTTDKDGKITITDLTPGKYDIETIKVPDGYDVTLGKSDTVVVEPGVTKKHDVYITKDPLGSLIITVYDEKTGDVVPGATIKVTDPSGVSTEYTTDSKGQVTIKDVPAGNYKIETTKVPDGYTVTVGKTETATVVAGQTASHDVYIKTSNASTTDTTTDTTTTTTNTDTNVKTGDDANLKLPAILMLISVVGVAYVLRSKKREN